MKSPQVTFSIRLNDIHPTGPNGTGDSQAFWQVIAIEDQSIRTREITLDLKTCHTTLDKTSATSNQTQEIDTKPHLDNWANQISQALKEFNYQGQSVLMSLPSDLFLPVQLPSEKKPTQVNAESLAYAVETQIPLDAEQITSTQPYNTKRHDHTLCISIQNLDIQPYVDSLEAHQIPVEIISPTAWLAASLHFNQQSDWVIVQTISSIDCFELNQGKPVNWLSQTTVSDQTSLTHSQDQNDTTAPPKTSFNTLKQVLSLPAIQTYFSHWHLHHTDDPTIKFLNLTDSEQTLPTSLPSHLNGTTEHRLNFRTGALVSHDRLRTVRPALNWCLLSLLCLLVASTSLLASKNYRAQLELEQTQKQQQASFRQAIPDQVIPLAIRSRLQSEYNRLRAETGLGEITTDTFNAWYELDQLLTHLPHDLRFRLDEIRVETNRITLDGEARSHSDTDRIAASLRKGNLDVQPPRVTRFDDRQGVRFSLQIQYRNR